MNFGQALEALKQNQKVAREGWNGKRMYIYLDYYPEHDSEPKTYDPFITMKTALGSHQPGWLASQADLLAEDWQIIN